MHLSSCKKTYNIETQRAVPLEETLARIEPKIPAGRYHKSCGDHRARPDRHPCLLLHQADRGGWGDHGLQRQGGDRGGVADLGIMEGIERYSSEIHDRKVRLDTFEMIEGREPAVNPEDLILPEDTDTGHVLPWVEGWDIANDKPVLVPAQAVFHPLPRNFRQIFRTSTNGLASGNTREEAIFHALCEVIERDAWSLVEACRKPARR